MAVVFDKILAAAAQQGVSYKYSQQSIEWFRAKVPRAVARTEVRPSVFLSDYERLGATWFPGNMYMMVYDPKGKLDLPYYDKFPLILPYKKVPGGFYGLNLHYLPPILRAKLMDAIWTDRLTNQKYDETTKMKLGARAYQVLSAGARYRWFKPCVKHYLDTHVRSRFILIEPREWTTALFLPSQQFMKATDEKVWRDSRNIIKKAG